MRSHMFLFFPEKIGQLPKGDPVHSRNHSKKDHQSWTEIWSQGGVGTHTRTAWSLIKVSCSSWLVHLFLSFCLVKAKQKVSFIRFVLFILRMISQESSFLWHWGHSHFSQGVLLKGPPPRLGINGWQLFVALGCHGRCGKKIQCTCLGSQHIVGTLSNGVHIMIGGDCLNVGEGLEI